MRCLPAALTDSPCLVGLLSKTCPALVGMASSWSALSDQEVFHTAKPVVLLGWLPLGLSSDFSQKRM